MPRTEHIHSFILSINISKSTNVHIRNNNTSYNNRKCKKKKKVTENETKFHRQPTIH